MPRSDSCSAKRLLVADDDGAFRAGFCQLLAELGYRIVGEAADGAAAITAACAGQADLVLMDASLPGGVDGIDTADLIRQAGGPPVLVMGASPDHQRVERAKAAGATGYLVKPFSVEQVVASIEFAT
jgi:response regulator NasT